MSGKEFRVIRLPELLTTIGLTRSTVDNFLSKKSPHYDATFPKPIKLGGRAIGWLESEVIEWIQSRIDAR